MMISNNAYGISTNFATTSAEKTVAGRAIPYGIRAETVDGNDPVVVWNAVDRAMRYCRRERKPFLLECLVSRLHGHSSSSGAQRDWNEADVLALFEQKLIDAGAIDAAAVKSLKDDAKAEADAAVVEAMQEQEPTREDVLFGTYAPSAVDAVYPEDYTGLPGQIQSSKFKDQSSKMEIQ
jgi:2-oxoisovalerate dehydrogenase E1 component alpha subunit